MVHWNVVDWEEIIDRAEAFFRKIKPEDKVVLVYHGDADGVTSALFISLVLKKFLGRIPEHRIWISTKAYKLKEERQIIDNINPDVLITTDLDIAKEDKLLRGWADKYEKVFMYDHHYIRPEYKETIPRSIEYLNARMLGDKNIWHPAAFFGYSLHQRFFKDDNYPWVAGIGLRGDHALDEYETLLEILGENYPELLKPIEGKDYKNLLEKAVYFINAGFFFSPDLHEETSYRVLLKAVEKNDYSFIYSGQEEAAELHDKRVELETSIERIYNEAKEKAEIIQDFPLIIYYINTTHYILGVIASMLVKDFPNKVVLILNRFDSEISGEIRQGENIDYNLVEMLFALKSDKNFEYQSVGGHPRAAGCLFNADQYEEFKSKFLEAFSEHN
ncbi:hypothetical protein J7L48_05865 [bacterium]|nr:hypothetical protein [bacterium]